MLSLITHSHDRHGTVRSTVAVPPDLLGGLGEVELLERGLEHRGATLNQP